MLQKKLSADFKVSAIQKEQIYANNQFESLMVSVEKGMSIPRQSALVSAGLYVIQGKMEFAIEDELFHVEKDDFFSFSKGQMHGLTALEDSKFLISRTIEK